MIMSDSIEYEVLIPSRVWNKYKTIKSYDDMTQDQRIAYDAYRTILDAGLEYCREKWGAVHRVGCMCCYGDGPDLNYQVNECKDRYGYSDQAYIKFTIDMDFNLEDHI